MADVELAKDDTETDKCRCAFSVTCWVHHDCSDGSCTHNDGDDYYEDDGYDDPEY